jgi:hypothetical protein
MTTMKLVAIAFAGLALMLAVVAGILIERENFVERGQGLQLLTIAAVMAVGAVVAAKGD